jgi:hypothetical protein
VTDVPLPAPGDTSWSDWATEEETASDEVLYGRLAAAALAESTRDTIGAGLVAGSGIAITVNDAGDTITIATTNVVTTSTKTTATYTFVLADSGTMVEGNSASAQTFTVPPNSSVAYPVGTAMMVRQYGAGQVTIAPGAGVTLRSRGAALKTAGQYAELALTKRAIDEWVITGDVTT